jgi:protein SCO1/2
MSLPAAAPPRHRTLASFVLPVVLGAAVAGVAGGVALHFAFGGRASTPATVVPSFQGAQSWAAGRRPAPAFALRDQDGRVVSLASLRGRTVLVTFLDSHCKQQCPLAGRELGSIVRSLPRAERPAVLIVSVNPADTARSARAAAQRWALAGGWHWLLGPRRRIVSVEHAYGIEVRPAQGDLIHTVALYLVDRRGFERTGYLFPFLPGFVTHDLRRLSGRPA